MQKIGMRKMIAQDSIASSIDENGVDSVIMYTCVDLDIGRVSHPSNCTVQYVHSKLSSMA
jgi:hypothetical protein